jgi:hypothetical protein
VVPRPEGWRAPTSVMRKTCGYGLPMLTPQWHVTRAFLGSGWQRGRRAGTVIASCHISGTPRDTMIHGGRHRE